MFRDLVSKLPAMPVAAPAPPSNVHGVDAFIASNQGGQVTFCVLVVIVIVAIMSVALRVRRRRKVARQVQAALAAQAAEAAQASVWPEDW